MDTKSKKKSKPDGAESPKVEEAITQGAVASAPQTPPQPTAPKGMGASARIAAVRKNIQDRLHERVSKLSAEDRAKLALPTKPE